MGLFQTRRENEGVNIEGNGRTIDIIVRRIGGTKRRREAYLEIQGVPNIKNLHLKYSDGLVKITDGVEIGIRDNVVASGKRAEFHYRVASIYSIKYREYP